MEDMDGTARGAEAGASGEDGASSTVGHASHCAQAESRTSAVRSACNAATSAAVAHGPEPGLN